MADNQTTPGDGTPAADVLDHNRELAKQVQDFARRMREIIHLCDSPGFTAAARRNAIREVARRK